MTPYYQDKAVTIYHANCREILPRLPKANLVLTDPPYGLNGNVDYGDFNDLSADVTELVLFVLKTALYERFVMTPGQSQMFKYPEPKTIGAFYYPAGAGRCSWGFVMWQPIFYYGKDPYGGTGSRPNGMSSTERAELNGHPCPKPIKQWTWLLNRYSLSGETILDPFMGSGTTLRAAKDLGRKAIGIEIEEKYCEIAAKRMAQEVLEFAA